MSALMVGIQFIGTIIILIISFIFARKIGALSACNGKEIKGFIIGFIVFILMGYTGIYIFASISKYMII